MATLNASERAAAERLLEAFCDQRYPPRFREHARPEIVWERGALTLYERRPPWRPDYGPEWSRQPIARFRRRSDGWTLYCARADGHWHVYGDRGPTRTIAPLIRDLAEDVTGIFWG